MTYEVLTAVNINAPVFWDVTILKKPAGSSETVLIYQADGVTIQQSSTFSLFNDKTRRLYFAAISPSFVH